MKKEKKVKPIIVKKESIEISKKEFSNISVILGDLILENIKLKEMNEIIERAIKKTIEDLDDENLKQALKQAWEEK